MTLFNRFLATAEAIEAFSDARLIEAMLRFESALARAEAAAGLIPHSAAQAIEACCTVQGFNLDAMLQDARGAGTIVIPLVQALRARVDKIDGAAAEWVHFGATSQDAIDSAMAMATRQVLDLITADLRRTVDGLRRLAQRHAATPMLARTLLQPASVTTFGLKCAHWALPLARGRSRIEALGARALCVQLGGAAGTRAQLGARADEVVAAVSAELSLAVPVSVWHTARDEWIALGCELGVLAGSLGKMARDFALLGQFEVAEIAEPGGGSSAMPHKRNPLGSMVARSAALRAPGRVAVLLAAMPQEHERALGGWQAECAEWGELLQLVHGSARAMAGAVHALHVDQKRMRDNLEAVRRTVSPEVASEWFDPAIAASLAAQVEHLCKLMQP